MQEIRMCKRTSNRILSFVSLYVLGLICFERQNAVQNMFLIQTKLDRLQMRRIRLKHVRSLQFDGLCMI